MLFHDRVFYSACLSKSIFHFFLATWVQRPYEEDDSDQIPEGKVFLSDFQIEKFTYYFTDVFDHNKDRVITIEDIQALNEVRIWFNNIFLSFHNLPFTI